MFESCFAWMRDRFLGANATHNTNANTTHFDGRRVPSQANPAFADVTPRASAPCPGGPTPPGGIDSDFNGWDEV